jgi:hypothetical protein
MAESFPMSDEEFERQYKSAKEAGQIADATEPRAISVFFEIKSRRIVIELRDGCAFLFPVDKVQGLAGASEADLSEIVIRAGGEDLHWPRLDWDYGVPDLMQGIFGSRKWMASQMGKAGGSVSSIAKAAAARENGKKGGRPRRAIAEITAPVTTSQTKPRKQG